MQVKSSSAWTQNVRRAALLLAVCLAGACILLVSQTTDRNISLSDQNEFESEPASYLCLLVIQALSNLIPFYFSQAWDANWVRNDPLCMQNISTYISQPSSHLIMTRFFSGFGGIPPPFCTHSTNAGTTWFLEYTLLPNFFDQELWLIGLFLADLTKQKI